MTPPMAAALRRTALILAGCALCAVLRAAAPEPRLEELDEVVVSAKVPRIPLSEFLQYPRFDSVVVSPGGTHIATGWGEDSYQRRVSVMDLRTLKPLRSGLLQIYLGVSDMRWLDEDRLLLQPDWPVPGLRRLRDHLGTLLVQDIHGRTLHELHPTPVGTIDAFEDLRRIEQFVKQTRIGPVTGPDAFGPLGVVAARTGPGRMLFQTLWTGGGFESRGQGIFELDVASGRQSRVAALPMRGGKVILGAENRPALVAGRNEAGEPVVYFLPPEARERGEDWKLVASSGRGERGLEPVAWTGNGEEYFALDGRDTPTRAVVVWNARDDTRRLLYRHADADMDVPWLDPAGKPWMFSGTAHLPVYWYPDPAHPLAQLHRTLTRQVPGEHVEILNATDDLSKAVVRVSSGSRPPVFLVVDVKAVRTITGMQTFPKLRGTRLAAVQPIEFRARDGLAIHGYLTTPLDKDNPGKTRRNLPLLVISHVGPRGETAGSAYEFERQLFASRGYAVLQVNARGSGGRGAAFEQAGDGRWGREVQDDFADAIRWAIDDGVAAAGKVCIYGTGYGAYTAMTVAAREPELVKCVIGAAGVYDLPQMESESDAGVATFILRHLEDGARGALTVSAALRKSAGSGREGNSAARQTAEALHWAAEYRHEISRKLGVALANGEKVITRPGSGAEGIPLFLRQAIGDDVDELRTRSPVSQASSIKARVLLLHQHLDKQVSRQQLDAMSRALKAAGNPARTATIGNEDGGRWEGHYTVQTRTSVYELMLRFLKDQIGP